MKYNSPRSKWTFSGLVLIAVFIFVFILFRAGALSRIPLPGSRGAAGPAVIAELQLTPERPVRSLPDGTAAVRIEPAEKGVEHLTLSVCGEVVLSAKASEGPTTDWFFLADGRDSLILTGAINCAVWEFSDKKGKLTTITDEHTFFNMKSVDSSNQSCSACKIPRGAVKARVTFRNDDIPFETGDSDILIYYGKLLQGYTDKSVTLPLPDLSENQAVVWEDGGWTLREGNQVIRQLDLMDPGFSAGDILKMEGGAGGSVTVTCYAVADAGETAETESAGQSSPNERSAEYGIRHSLDNGISVCERLGDARGAHFGFMVDNDWYGDGDNDFDSFYPWSEMRLCNISVHDGMREFIYEDDPRFSRDGSSGNVMVEIPKFYVKRTVADGYEEVWISGVRHDGYEIEPVFVLDGKELEHVYVSAYLGSVSGGETADTQDGTVSAAGAPNAFGNPDAADGPDAAASAVAVSNPASAVVSSDPASSATALPAPRLVSISGAYPEIRVPYSKLLEMARNNGEGFSEINFLMYQAIQKLFLVETGSLDCSSLIIGHAKGYFYYPGDGEDSSKTCSALDSAVQTNTVRVTSLAAWKIAIGNSVILLDRKSGWDAYDDGGTARCREVIRIEKDPVSGITTLTLDGEPFDVTEGETIVSGYPTRSGRMDKLSYPTSVYHCNNGKHAFKYRGIENIYATSLLLLDSDAYISGSYFFYRDGNGQLQKIREPVPIQTTSLNVSEKGFTQGNVNCIRRMSFDPDHPTVMVPSECGASSYNYYGDYWLYRPKSDDVPYYLAVGGAYDNDRLCGIFQMRGLFTSKDFRGNFHVGRIMYREP